MIVFFDASALIYLIEGREPFVRNVRAAMEGLLRRDPGASTAVSRLSWLECRIGPLKNNDAESLSRYDAFFSRPDVTWVELTREVIELAAAIRARHGLRTPDALQAACCLQLGHEHQLLTGDAAFQRVVGLNVVLIA